MGQRCLWLILLAVGGCFSPSFNDGAIQCGPNNLCPPGLDCFAGVCREQALPIDAAVDPDAPGMVTLTLTKTGTGMGDVTSVPAGIVCGATCVGTFPTGTRLTLTATPASGSILTRWSGACTSTGSTCSLTLTANTSASADFGKIMHTLTVVAGGNGTGGITSSPLGINCPGICTLQIPDATDVTLTAAPTGASTFLGWTGASCTGTGTCNFKMSADTTVTGSFALDYSIVVVKDATGTGTGTVVSTTPAGGINCGVDCVEAYAINTVVTLDAAADGNSDFIGWSGGGCSGTGSCVVSVTAAVMVTAKFNLKQFPLSVGFMGTGTGTVTSNPIGISCGSDCNETYPSGTMVTLTAVPTAGSMFTGWSGPGVTCIGTGPCTVQVFSNMSVTATFDPQLHLLDIAKPGNGVGLVTGAGINCGLDCNQLISNGTSLILTAAESPGSVFTGWSGAPGCSTAPMCSVTVTAPITVTATFTLTTHMLTVTVPGGMGTVASNPAGITNCGGTGGMCSATFNYNTMVTLTPSPGTGSSFAGWSGACTGLGACVVTMDMVRMVNAQFVPQLHDLTVTLSGAGMGLVTSNPPGISCSGGTSQCTKTYTYDTDVTLTAMPTAPSIFIGWGGACSGTTTCVVDMISAQNVIATFSPPPNLMFVTSAMFTPGTPPFMGAGVIAADNVCQNVAMTRTPPLPPGNYKAWVSSPGSNAIDRLGTASGWVRVDGQPFANSKSDIGRGFLFNPPRIDERGNDLFDQVVVTATGSNGLYDNGGDCNNWTAGATGSVQGGHTMGGSIMFTKYQPLSCNQPMRLYCFGTTIMGIPNQAIVVPLTPTVPVRRAFMTTWAPGGVGIANADLACQNDADANNLPGTYRALLATTTKTALQRFILTGFPWVRVDNVPLRGLTDGTALGTAAFFDSGPNLSADGTFMWENNLNWAGAPDLNTFGTSASTCNDWTSPALSATRGVAGHTKIGSSFFDSIPSSCAFPASITCLQE